MRMESVYNESQHIEVSQSTLNMLFWMLDESNSKSLELQGERLLNKLFDSIAAAGNIVLKKKPSSFH